MNKIKTINHDLSFIVISIIFFVIMVIVYFALNITDINELKKEDKISYLKVYPKAEIIYNNEKTIHTNVKVINENTLTMTYTIELENGDVYVIHYKNIKEIE